MIAFSVVTAVHDVARYLDDFLSSLDAQDHPHDRIQVVAVDDGSSDDSLERLRRWAERTDLDVTVLSQSNAGQGSARNLGLEHATGDWVLFPDPDDRLDATYLSAVSAFLAHHPETDAVAGALWVLDDGSGRLSDTHPMRDRFADGDRLVDLSVLGDYFFGSVNAGCFRRDRIEEAGLRFDVEIRPTFEDAHFVGRYLLETGSPPTAPQPAAPPPTGTGGPLVAFVASARYHYRRRADDSSTLQTSYDDPRRYTIVPERGHLDLLRRASRRHGGRVPQWVQEQVIYDLSWTLSRHDARDGDIAAKGEIAETFHRLLGQITELLDVEVIDGFRWRRLKPEWRALLAHGYRPEPWHSEQAVLTAYDAVTGLVQLSYLYVGEPPSERVWAGGQEVRPLQAKHRDIVALEQVRVRERILWLPAGESARLQLDARDLPIVGEPVQPAPVTLRPGELQRLLSPRRSPAVPEARRRAGRKERLLRRLARTRLVRRRYGDAWLLVDRAHDADDSAEHLFRYLRHERPEVNAWFTVEEGTPDWQRLRRDVGRRVVPFGSMRWKLLMLNTTWLVSSHAENVLLRPQPLAFTAPTWRFAFLQHGVIKDDLSGWLNRKPIDAFVTSTPAEYDSIVRDGSGYRFTSKEVVLSELPRFDRLREQANEVAPEERDLVLVAPTWRAWLVDRPRKDTHRRRLETDAVESDFVQAWMGLLADRDLAEACERHGLRLAFLPHPNMQPLLDRLDLPAHVQPIRYAGTDVRALVARCRLMITDYSSMAFNAGYVERPVLYYQFDAERVRTLGSHVGRPDYFDYVRDGFGPVREHPDDVVRTAVEMIEAGPFPDPAYRARAAATFTLRDGHASRRVTDFLLASTRRAPRDAVVAPVPGTSGPTVAAPASEDHAPSSGLRP
ncbi:CDP-glycerol glycerophosphotransferase family protein [Nocardioides sp. AN3]